MQELQGSENDQRSAIRSSHHHMVSEDVWLEILGRQTKLRMLCVYVENLCSKDLTAIMDAIHNNSTITDFMLGTAHCDAITAGQQEMVKVSSIVSDTSELLSKYQLLNRTDMDGLKFQVRETNDPLLRALCTVISKHETLNTIVVRCHSIETIAKTLKQTMKKAINGNQIEKLVLNCREHLSDAVSSIYFQNNTALKFLCLNGYVDRCEGLLLLLQKLVHLEELGLVDSNLSDKQTAVIIRTVHQNGRFDSLRLHECVIGEETCAALTITLSSSGNLSQLALSKTKFHCELAEKFFGSLPFDSKLQTLILKNNDFMHIKRSCFGDLITNLLHLVHLNLCNNQLHRVALDSISSAMRCNRKLQTLNLSNNDLSGPPIRYLCECLVENTHLRQLGVSCCQLDMDDFKHLMRYITKTKTLRNIGLMDNEEDIRNNDFQDMIYQAYSLNYSLTGSDIIQEYEGETLMIQAKRICSIFERNKEIHTETEAFRLRVPLLIMYQVILFGAEHEKGAFRFSVLPGEVMVLILHHLASDDIRASYLDILKIMEYGCDRKNIDGKKRQEFKDIFTREKGQKRKL